MLECFLRWMAYFDPLKAELFVSVYNIIGNIVTLSFEAEPTVKEG